MSKRVLGGCRAVADIFDTDEDLGIVAEGIADSSQTIPTQKMQNLGEVLVILKLASGEIDLKFKNEADSSLDYSSGTVDNAITDTAEHVFRFELADLAKPYWGLKIEESDSSTYELEEFLVIEMPIQA